MVAGWVILEDFWLNNWAGPTGFPFQSSEGEEHSDPRALQIIDRVSVLRASTI